MNKLSHSAVRMYSECGRKYYYHYVARLRSIYGKGALLFGSAIDSGLNTLLLTKDLPKAIESFEKVWEYQTVNQVKTYLPEAGNIVYAKTDFDAELLTKEDYEKFEDFKLRYGLVINVSLEDHFSLLREKKSINGFKNMSELDRRTYGYINWLCLRQKGLIMLNSYNKKILPRIKEVLEVQKDITIQNSCGDEINAKIDIILRWEDDNLYVMDNKTTSSEYESDSAAKSQQLIWYYHILKPVYPLLHGDGFFPIYKQIVKNRTKTCISCKYNGTGGRHKTCPNMIEEKRCNGEWEETICPEARIEVILNQVSETAENLVIETFDEANEGIKRGVFNPNLQACGNGDWTCPYINKCWYGNEEELTKVREYHKK